MPRDPQPVVAYRKKLFLAYRPPTLVRPTQEVTKGRDHPPIILMQRRWVGVVAEAGVD
jgi:hypothetical protein